MNWFLRILFGWEWAVRREEDRAARQDTREKEAFALEVVEAVCHIPLDDWSKEGKGTSLCLTAHTKGGAAVRLRCYPDWDGGILYDLYVDGLPVNVDSPRKQRRVIERLWDCHERVVKHLSVSPEPVEAPKKEDVEAKKRAEIRQRL